MTREEAIAYGKECLSWNKFSKDMKMYQFIEMAIKALSQEPCDDAISRADAQTEIMMSKSIVAFDMDIWIRTKDAVHILRQLPSVTQKSGKWIEHPEIETSTPEYLMFYECSECGNKQCFCKSDIHKKRFCSNCGAKMESEDKA